MNFRIMWTSPFLGRRRFSSFNRYQSLHRHPQFWDAVVSEPISWNSKGRSRHSEVILFRLRYRAAACWLPARELTPRRSERRDTMTAPVSHLFPVYWFSVLGQCCLSVCLSLCTHSASLHTLHVINNIRYNASISCAELPGAAFRRLDENTRVFCSNRELLGR